MTDKIVSLGTDTVVRAPSDILQLELAYVLDRFTAENDVSLHEVLGVLTSLIFEVQKQFDRNYGSSN